DLNAIVLVNPYIDPPTTFDMNFTPLNSHVTGIFNYVVGPDAWAFDFASDNLDPLGDPTFEISNDAVYYQPSYFQIYGIPYGPGVDPVGVWSSDVRAVPDASSTMTLLFGAISALGMGRHMMRRR